MNEEYPVDNTEYNLGYRAALKDVLTKIEDEADRMANVRSEAGYDDAEDFYNIAMQCHYEVEKLLKAAP